ncbi:MAG: hypothetical protein Q7U54_21540 [Bacteroidales bacterium]|nr:hypothetical protein [Bacteroidales bacterium]
MKNLALIFLTLLLGVAVSAQVTQSFRYQAVARDGAGNVLAGKDVSFRISFLLGSTSGSTVYIETHLRTTNAFGLVDLEIGLGTPVSGSFTGINWGAETYFVKVEMDPNGGSSYQWMGTSQLLSVPYALYAKDVQNNNDADADPANELQKISISGTVLTLDKSGGSVTLPSSGGDDNWGTQTVVTDATLSGNGTTSTPLKIAENGVNSSKIADGSIVAADIANSAITTDKINAGSVTGAKIAQAGATSGQALKWNGTTWAPGADETGTGNPTGAAGGDLSGTYPNPVIGDTKVTSAKIVDGTVSAADLANNAVTSDKINAGAVTGAKIAQAGATSGQALKWNGTTWAPAADATGGSSSGWTDDGTIIRLSTATDSVQIGNVSRLGKLNIGGNIGMNLLSSIYFGSDATRITGLTGGDLRLVAEDLSMLTTEDITFGRYGDETWIKFDNANKRVGIGTISPTDRLHVVLDNSSVGLSAVRGVATSAAGSAYGVYGQSAGFKGRGIMGEATGTSSIGVMGLATNTSSTGVWGEGSNQGVYGKSDLATGKGIFGQVTSATAYSGYFDGGKFYISGNVGIGTTSPAKKLHVNGSVQIKDTLYASAVRITNSPRVFYKNSSTGWPKNISTMESWGPLDSIVVVAPGPGSVLLNVTGFLQSSHTYLGNSWVYVGISASRRSSNFDDALSKTVWLLHETLVGGFYQVPCAVTAVATVASGGTYKYYIVGWFNEWDGEEDEVDFGSGAFSALFIPSP